MKRFIIIISLLFFANSVYSNELPILTYAQQPALKLNNEKNPIIVKFNNIKLEEKKEEKTYKITEERPIISNSPRRSYRNCTSLG